jgi:hypothetical protein
MHKSAQDYLNECAQLLANRGKQYDSKGQERSMAKIVQVFELITKIKLSEYQGWVFMQVLKLVRANATEEPHLDSILDGINYGALAAESIEKKPEIDTNSAHGYQASTTRPGWEEMFLGNKTNPSDN